jgi:type IV pilus assembly protein PilA
MLNTKLKQSGFTIVELLIVIVVIAILAAISIVAYNGIQSRGKASAAQSLANSIVKKAEAFNTIESTYPATYNGFGNGGGTAGNPAEAKLDEQGKVTNSLPSDEKTVMYKKCATGAAVYYYNAATGKNVGIGLGGQASASDVVASGAVSPQVNVCS